MARRRPNPLVAQRFHYQFDIAVKELCAMIRRIEIEAIDPRIITDTSARMRRRVTLIEFAMNNVVRDIRVKAREYLPKRGANGNSSTVDWSLQMHFMARTVKSQYGGGAYLYFKLVDSHDGLHEKSAAARREELDTLPANTRPISRDYKWYCDTLVAFVREASLVLAVDPRKKNMALRLGNDIMRERWHEHRRVRELRLKRQRRADSPRS